MTNNLNYIKKSQALVKRFEEEQDPEFLSAAYIELQKVNIRNEKDLTVLMHVRVEALLQWLKLIKILDDHIDPAFDINEGGTLKVLPKTNYNGVDYPSWVDPASIDANAAAEFRKASEENDKKLDDFNLQVSFSRLNQHIPRLAKTFVHKNYTGLPTDQLELKTTIEKTLKNPARKEDFLTLLAPIIKK